MYGPDARLLIGVSSHPSDPLREVAEVSELETVTGLWKFSTFDFTDSFEFDANPASCADCHGDPPFGGREDNLTDAEVDSMMLQSSTFHPTVVRGQFPVGLKR